MYHYGCNSGEIRCFGNLAWLLDRNEQFLFLLVVRKKERGPRRIKYVERFVFTFVKSIVRQNVAKKVARECFEHEQRVARKSVRGKRSFCFHAYMRGEDEHERVKRFRSMRFVFGLYVLWALQATRCRSWQIHWHSIHFFKFILLSGNKINPLHLSIFFLFYVNSYTISL